MTVRAGSRPELQSERTKRHRQPGTLAGASGADRSATVRGARNSTYAVRLNVNENPYPPSERVAAEIAAAVAREAGRMNRYPDREAEALRSDLAGYLGHGLGAASVWAANGSNEVITQVLQAFGGPGRTLLTFSPTYSMYPEYARNTHTRYVTSNRRDDFGIDVDRPWR